jgi:hypothetical protein
MRFVFFLSNFRGDPGPFSKWVDDFFCEGFLGLVVQQGSEPNAHPGLKPWQPWRLRFKVFRMQDMYRMSGGDLYVEPNF